ncbi:MAG: aldehyde ferredoxin oxidoreductase family protein, partial [Candidatus Bipolaricaulis sp.]|nr:aldehyde ferredoxin oxidoreductase family protein [Candidatus Bipolaricaulis sp.]
MNGRTGRYLDVNLSTGRIRDYAVPEAWFRLHLGGKGVAARILLEELPARVDPLGAENILVFATGPLQGTAVVGAGRHAVLAVSPKTGRVADSYAGGYFGHELGRSAYDGILVRGQSPRPVYLSLVDGVAALHPAGDLWGMGTGETETTLQTRFPRSRVSSIGIAGESLVSQACIINDRTRSAGRPGLGAVMGSKRLKAIVVRGHGEKPLHNPARFRAERADYAKRFLGEGPQGFGKYGTASGVAWLSEQGILPTRNFAEGVFADAEAIGGERMHDTILVARDTCAACPVRCKRAVRTTFAGCDVLPEFGGPEYETVAAFGSMCLNSDLASIALANQLCNDYGLDTISAGVAVAFLMEAHEKGFIDEEIEWGDPHAVVSVVHALARREGIGDRLADGLELFARALGADFAMTIKGVELPMHEPRGKQGLGLSYATTPRGANHMEGMHDTLLTREAPCPELGIGHSYDRFTLLDKAGPAVVFEDLRSFTNSLVLCCFTTSEVGPNYSFPAVRSLLEAATGLVV